MLPIGFIRGLQRKRRKHEDTIALNLFSILSGARPVWPSKGAGLGAFLAVLGWPAKGMAGPGAGDP